MSIQGKLSGVLGGPVQGTCHPIKCAVCGELGTFVHKEDAVGKCKRMRMDCRDGEGWVPLGMMVLVCPNKNCAGHVAEEIRPKKLIYDVAPQDHDLGRKPITDYFN